jgi:hypothetical protein
LGRDDRADREAQCGDEDDGVGYPVVVDHRRCQFLDPEIHVGQQCRAGRDPEEHEGHTPMPAEPRRGRPQQPHRHVPHHVDHVFGLRYRSGYRDGLQLQGVVGRILPV